MTRIDALRALYEAVKAEETLTTQFAAVFSNAGFTEAIAAYSGSLDAALALHEVVLPGWLVGTMCQLLDVGDDMEYTGTASDWMVNLARCDGTMRIDSEIAATPARSWLLAIIAALIAQAEKAGKGE